VDASELTEGTLDDERFSAYEDLAAEDKIGETSDQVAAGDHMHTGGSFSGTIFSLEDNSIIIENIPPATTLKTIHIPTGQISDFFRVSFPISCGYVSGNGTIQIFIIVNDQWLSDPIEYGSSGPYPRNNTCLMNGLRLENDVWVISYQVYSDASNMLEALETISLDLSSGMTLELYASYVADPTARVTLGNLIVEYDVD
jgi:hypothetical protein